MLLFPLSCLTCCCWLLTDKIRVTDCTETFSFVMDLQPWCAAHEAGACWAPSSLERPSAAKLCIVQTLSNDIHKSTKVCIHVTKLMAAAPLCRTCCAIAKQLTSLQSLDVTGFAGSEAPHCLGALAGLPNLREWSLRAAGDLSLQPVAELSGALTLLNLSGAELAPELVRICVHGAFLTAAAGFGQRSLGELLAAGITRLLRVE